jgi:phage portal protein BeeE
MRLRTSASGRSGGAIEVPRRDTAPERVSSISDFWLNLVRNLYDDGNAYALALRNNRFEIAELHLLDSRITRPQIAQDGSIFYNAAGNPIVDRIMPQELTSAIPARDVLHVRLDSRTAIIRCSASRR